MVPGPGDKKHNNMFIHNKITYYFKLENKMSLATSHHIVFIQNIVDK